jgi:SNF family Na+-dependent transporter
MLILEMKLGQKMKKRSAGAMRGIYPRLGGAGWAAAFAGFITCVIYNIIMGLVFLYLIEAGNQPWNSKNYKRAPGCMTAEKSGTGAAELFLYMNATKVFDPETCEVYTHNKFPTDFAGALFRYAAMAWVLCFLCIVGGPKVIGPIATVTAILPFILIIVLDIGFMGVNNKVGGKGMQYYFSGGFPLQDGSGNYDPSSERKTLLKDAFNQVFYSLGVGVGIFFAYASYNPIRQPVISIAVGVALLDWIFAIIAGFAIWGAVGFLMANRDPAAYQTGGISLMFVGIS